MRSAVRWQTPSTVARDRPVGFAKLPRSPSPSTRHEETVYLLQLAAEVEHSLLVQYLYAAYSLGFSSLWPPEHAKQLKSWSQTITAIAVQEMGHLATVQNLLWCLGGALHFGREELPHRSPFYPFSFELEPLTKDSLAKYVAAEMPPWFTLDSGTKRQLRPILYRAMGANQGKIVNRVGALYHQIKRFIQRLHDDDFLFASTNFQGVKEEWPLAVDQTSNDPLAGRLLVCPIENRQDALEAVDLISQQGEGLLTASLDHSHFQKFFHVYNEFPETNPQFGLVNWVPALAVPNHPNTSPGREANPLFDKGRITDPTSRRLAHLLNLRYRNVLELMSHYFVIDRQSAPDAKSAIATWARDEMLDGIKMPATILGLFPRKSPTEFENGLQLVAGAPFELNGSVGWIASPWGRWKTHLDKIDISARLIEHLLKDKALPKVAVTTLTDILQDDVARRDIVLHYLKAPTPP